MSKEKPQLQDRDFQRLLGWLDPDSDRSADAYLNFHRRLTGLFVNRNCCGPEELAYEALERVAGQLADGKEIAVPPKPYLHGVAKNIALEHWRTCQDCKRRRMIAEDDDERQSLESLAVVGFDGQSEDAQEKERRLQCLDDCLDELAVEERSLLLQYYSEDKTLKIVTRDRMAARLGATSGALRQRIWKVRASVRDCVVKCVAG
jgi:RNA polymerase sigma factor (sigma-70 family)